MRNLSIILILLMCGFTSKAQEKYAISLDLKASIEIAKKQSFKMRQLQEDLNGAEYQLKAATSAFKTHIDLDLVLPNYSEGVESIQDENSFSYFTDKQLSYSGNLKINQPLPTDGNLFVESGLFNRDDYDQDDQIMRLKTRFGLSQPIQSLYMYNHIKSEFEKAKTNYELSHKKLKRTELNVIYDVSKSFYDLHSAKEKMKIDKMKLENQKKAYQIAKNKYDAGLIREVEALQMEVDLGEARNDHDLSTVSYKRQLNLFKQTLGLSLQDSINLITNFEYAPVSVDMRKAVDEGLKNRLELKEKELEKRILELDLKRIKSQGTISGSLNAYYDFIGIDNSDIDISLEKSIRNSWKDLQHRPGNFGVSLTLRIPILDWGENKAKVRSTQSIINRTMVEKEEQTMIIEREIIHTVNSLNSSLRRLQLLEKNLTIAEKSFKISQSRYSNGDIDAQALALDRDRLNGAYNSRLAAYISYKLNIADLARKTFYDFEKDQQIQ